MTAINKSKHFAAALLVGISLGSAAQAQSVLSYYPQPEPLYPYAVQQQPYTYPQPQYTQPAYPYVRTPHVRPVPRTQSKTDPALVEELRKGRHKKHVDDSEKVAKHGKDETCKGCDKDIKIDKKIIVRENPIVRKHIRVVDNPPIVVQRQIDIDSGQVISEQRVSPAQAQAPLSLGTARVIHAEAEVTILGPDRMSIRLYRKQDARDANAKADSSTSAPKNKKLKTSKTEKGTPQT